MYIIHFCPPGRQAVGANETQRLLKSQSLQRGEWHKLSKHRRHVLLCGNVSSTHNFSLRCYSNVSKYEKIN